MRSLTASLRQLRAVAAFSVLFGAMLLACGQAIADETGLEDNPPQIGGGAVSPSNLSYEGGNVQLSAEVVDDFGVSMVYAQIYKPDGSTELIQLYQGDHDTYYGTLEVPPNSSGEEVNYGVEIQAWDTNGAYAATLIGGVQEEAAPQFDEYPYLNEPTLTPAYLPAEGGTSTISVEASDNHELTRVFAIIVPLPLGGETQLPMHFADYNRWEAAFTPPPNLGPLTAEYLIEIVAEDDVGQQTRVGAGTIVVEAPPPVPPSIGQLRTRPGTHRFGSVHLRRTARRDVIMRNVPGKGGEPVEATARIAGSPAFSLAGASADGIHFMLNPGKRQTFHVKFHPTTAGQQTASLEILRDDGGQQGFVVALAGRGSLR
jgi:hypothetical protein